MSPKKKPPAVSWQSFVEQQIREAQEEGKFDNLPGFGRPLPLLDEPYDELWWIKRKARQENLALLPPSLQIRVDIEKTRERIAVLDSEAAVRDELEQLNDRIRRANLSSAWGPPSTAMPLDVEQAVQQWRRARGEGGKPAQGRPANK